MRIHQLYRCQLLNLSIEEGWDFFSSPFHLNDITPDFFHVDVLSRVPEKMYSGLMIHYRMKAVLGWPMAWLSEVSHCDEPKRFVYEQRIGPFKFWSHEVCLNKIEGGILLEDIIFYVMPFGFLGEILNRFLISLRLERIFDTRNEHLRQLWGTMGEQEC